MKSIIINLVLCFSSSLISSLGEPDSWEAGRFRCDYVYIPDGEGYYKLHTQAAIMEEARVTCEIEGAVLASPNTNDDVKKAMHILLSEQKPEYQYITDNGVHTGIMQKENYHSASYIVMNKDGNYHNIQKNDFYPFICYKKGELSVELNECGTLDSEYVRDERTGKCYKYHKDFVNWYMAQSTCIGEEAQMAIVRTKQEAKAFGDIFRKAVKKIALKKFWKERAFIGFRTNGYNQDWYTIDGDPLNINGLFAHGEPNNNTKEYKFCGAISQSGMLFDDSCSRKLPFICEKKKYSDCDVFDESHVKILTYQWQIR